MSLPIYPIYLVFLFLSLAISIGFQLILPPPYGLVAAIGVFVALPLLLRRRFMSRMRGFGGSGSSGGSGAGIGGGLFGMNQGSGPVRYVCLVCHKTYKGGECPRCGSKMKRADF